MLIPGRGGRDGFVPTLPDSLKRALLDFVLASAGRLARSDGDEACTMLVHTGMRRALQNPLAPDITRELAYIRQRWLYEADEYRPSLRARWNESFRPTSASLDVARDQPFEAIEPHIDRLLRDGIGVRVLNSDWPDGLDFDQEPTLKAVLIGGNKLSRGVTIEGLLVSYYVRETLYYDTLMQMGRWFGYRGSYVDLTRLYSTELLVSCFHDLATAEEELRRQIARYEREHLTPTQFVPRVRTHPLMAVTQRAKMQAAVEVSVNYAGELAQTLRFPQRPSDDLERNLATTHKLLVSLGPSSDFEGKPFWAGVEPTKVLDFLGSYRLMPQTAIDPRSVVDYIKAQMSNGELTRWTVLVSRAVRPPKETDGWVADLGISGEEATSLIARTRLAKDPTSLGVVTDPGDELVGLSAADVRQAEEDMLDARFRSRAEALRAQRPPEEGLLLIYPISVRSQPLTNSKSRIPLFDKHLPEAPALVAYALSFPHSRSQATVEYVAAPPPRDLR